MENKIQALTDKLYQDGVEKGNKEAERLITEAKKQRDEILKSANDKASAIVSAAEKKASEISDNTKSELKLFSEQAVNSLKSEIATLISDKIVNTDVKAFLSNKDFLNSFIVSLAKQWSANEPICISCADATALKGYFMAQAKELLNKGVTINEVKGLKTSFSISPADGSYKINFGEEEFVSYLKDFLRPQLIEMLFN